MLVRLKQLKFFDPPSINILRDVRQCTDIRINHCMFFMNGLAPCLPKPQTAADSALNGMIFYSKLQTEDGHWSGDYGGPLFLMAGVPADGVLLCTEAVGQATMELREKLYTQAYDTINWASQRNNVAPGDMYTPHSRALDWSYRVLNTYEPWHVKKLRSWAVSECLDHIRADDQFTDCISVGPISKVIQMLVRWHADGPDSEAFKTHVSRIPDYLWALTSAQAFLEAGAYIDRRFSDCMKALHRCFKETQVPENPPNYSKYYRQMSKGAFPFSTVECGWVVSDCMAEGLKSFMMLQEKCSDLNDEHVEDQRMLDCVNVLLKMQNTNGGYASYETKRGGAILEILNPSEVFALPYKLLICLS
eukprot:Em0012g389a